MADFDHRSYEKKWQDYWEEHQIYRFDPDSSAPVYSIDNPPRYASGPLHAGHAVHYTHIDFIARYKRMNGYNVMFPLCFDVNGMPIEVNVEKKYNIQMGKYDRHAFIELCEEFAEANIGEMKRQFKILGESMDESVYYQTDAKYYRRLTQLSFIRLFRRELIYKGKRPVNWCPRCTTALADAEIEYGTRDTHLNYLPFSNVATGEVVDIATTRPELLCTCQIVAICPDDDRADALVGEKLRTPLFDREVEVIADENVDPAFGTGIVMICTIGDRDDLEWVQRYDLPLEMGIDDEGRMTAQAGPYEGMNLNQARDQIIADLDERNLLNKQEPLEQSVGCCWRCHTPIEFLVKPQWFLSILPFKKEVLAAADEMDWFPPFMKVRLEDWVNSLGWDWVISRQRYFATPIPIWECEECQEVVLARERQCYVDPTIDRPPVEECPACGGALHGCEDVFDTWMDSSISPLYNTFWERDESLFRRLYPMSLRPQAHDIIRTWAFYTILRGLLLAEKKPFEEMMIDGFILAEDGTPMHASKGNIIDPLEVLEEYGADAYRYYAAQCSVGEDNAFRFKDVTRGVKFCRKLYHIGRFIRVAEEKIAGAPNGDEPSTAAATPIPTTLDADTIDTLPPVDRWILSKFTALTERCIEAFDNFRFDRVLREVEYFVWHELADHYIELIKHRLYQARDRRALTLLGHLFYGALRFLAPLLPHITEELYQTLFRTDAMALSIHRAHWPEPQRALVDAETERAGELVKRVVGEIRRYKSDAGIALNAPLERITLVTEDPAPLQASEQTIAETVHAETLAFGAAADLVEAVVGLEPNFAAIGPQFKQRTNAVVGALHAADPTEVAEALASTGVYELSLGNESVGLTSEHIDVQRSLTLAGETVDTVEVDDVVIAIKNRE